METKEAPLTFERLRDVYESGVARDFKAQCTYCSGNANNDEDALDVWIDDIFLHGLKKLGLQTLDQVSSQCLMRPVLQLHRKLGSIYNEALRPVGLTAAQFTLLVAITRRGPISPGTIATRLAMDKSTMSRNVALMKKRGWLAIVREKGEPGRSHSLVIKPAGRALLERALPLWAEAQAEAVTLLGNSGAAAVREASNAIEVSLV